MKRILLVLFMAVAVGTGGFVGVVLVDPEKADAARLRNFTKTDTAVQSGDNGVNAEDARINNPDDPFSFSGVGKLHRITQVSITATIFDGDTGPGEADENELTLALDDIDTGIKLNGYTSDQTVTRTNSGAPANASQIEAALKEDDKLNASIIDAATDNNVLIIPDFVPGLDETTLTIKGKRRR